jgi:hypothetical protein
MKNNKMYSVMFPLWFLLVFPITWLVVIPVNFIIDTIVILVGLKYFKVENAYETYKKVILKIWALGFAANIIGSGLLFLTQFLIKDEQGSLYSAVTSRVAWNPFNSVSSSILVILSVAVSMILIYFFNYRVSFKKVGLNKNKAKKLATLLAIITAPWLLLFPSQLIYKGMDYINIPISEEVINETKSVEIKNVLNELDGSTYIEDGVFDSKDLKVSVNCNITTEDSKQVNEYKNLFESAATDELLNANAVKIFSKISYVDDVIFKISNDKTYAFNRNNIK